MVKLIINFKRLGAVILAKNDISQIQILKNESLSKYTFTETGGPADYLAFPKNREELIALVEYCHEMKVPITVIGNASNLIIKDGGIRGMVIILPEFKTIKVNGNKIIAEAGATIIETTKVASKNSLSGLEFAAGIPGSVGGAVFMNAGAYGGEISECLESAEILLPSGNIEIFSNKDMNFSYRMSEVQKNSGIVISATFALNAGKHEEIQAKMDELNELRRSKQPLEYPSCGSVFKRPEGYFTGPLIIKAGLQGHWVGGAQVSEKHAGFIVNKNHEASATDYINLIKLIQKTIKEKFDIELETEVRIIGEDK